jgi:hypothetical protein
MTECIPAWLVAHPTPGPASDDARAFVMPAVEPSIFWETTGAIAMSSCANKKSGPQEAGLIHRAEAGSGQRM